MNDLLDEELLMSALAEQAGLCPPPLSGPEAVLAAASDLDSSQDASKLRRGLRRVARPARAHPVLAVAASLTVAVVVAGGLGVSGVIGSPSGTANVASTHAATGGAPKNFAAGPQISSAQAGSGTSAPSRSSNSTATTPSVGQGSSSSGLGTTPITGPVVVSTGNVTLVVPKGEFSSAMGRLGTLATGSGGFVSQSETDTEGGSPSGTLTLRVPSASFLSVVSGVEAVGKTTSSSTSSQDQTSQYVDLTARITALEDTRSQFESILAQATSISDIISVETQIGDLQTQIEQLQGQQQVLSDQATYATLTVNVSEQGAPQPPHGRSGIDQAWHDAVSGFVSAGEGIVAASGAILFGLICLVVLVLVGRPVIRRLRRRII